MGFGKLLKSKKLAIKDETLLDGIIDKGIFLCNDRTKKPQEFFRVSSVGKCIRQTYYRWIQKDEDIGAKLLTIFNMGDEIHELYQKYLQASGRLFGNNYCSMCDNIDGPDFVGISDCEDCGTPLKYSELSLINEKLKVVGHPDGLIKIRKNLDKVSLIEIKSISPYYRIHEGVSNVYKFVPEYINQPNFYLGMLRHSKTYLEGDHNYDYLEELLDRKNFYLIFHDKGNCAKTIYPFSFDLDMFKEDTSNIKLFFKHLRAGTTPPANGHKKCKYCDFSQECNKEKVK